MSYEVKDGEIVLERFFYEDSTDCELPGRFLSSVILANDVAVEHAGVLSVVHTTDLLFRPVRHDAACLFPAAVAFLSENLQISPFHYRRAGVIIHVALC